MARKTIEMTFAEVRSLEDGLMMEVYSFKWMAENGMDSQKPIYITPDNIKQIYYIDGWEIEDAEKKED